MLRRLIVASTLLIALAFAACTTAGPAAAQSGPLCTAFGEGTGGLDSWGACSTAPNIVVTTSNVGSMGGAGDYHLHLRDTSGASAACSTDQKYLGNWVEKMGGCGQFCFDFKLFKSGVPPGPVTPSFTIWNGGQRATFVANFTVTENDPWRHICAPIKLIEPGENLPSGASGSWQIAPTGNGYNAAWNTTIQGVTMMQLPIDFTSNPSEEAGYDNLCMTPGGCGEKPKPPEIKGCLQDSKVAVKCNGDGTYTVTLSGSGFSGTDITMTSQTSGVTVTPPQQPWSATTTWTVSGATPGQTVVLTANATKIGGGKEPGTDQCCSGEIKIVMPECEKPKTGDVVVEKKVKNNTKASASAINSLVFPIGLACGLPSNLNVSFGLSNGGTHTDNNVPYGSLCTVTEAISTLPPVPVDACGQGGVAVWATPVIVPASATISAPVTAFTVINELNCEKTGSLVVEKKVESHLPVPLPSLTFPITVTCGAPANTSTSFGLTDNGSHTVSGIADTSTCTVAEGPPPLPNVCPPRFTPAWTTTYSPSNSAVISGSVATIKVLNVLACKPPKQECLPPMVLNVDGICVCPPGTVLHGKECVKVTTCPPPMVPGPVVGQCICPQGTVLRGKECVKVVIDCHPPMVPNLAGTSCGCPQGTVLRGRECVKVPPPLACKPPLVPNAAGTDCVCRGGLVLRGRKCVEPIVCRAPAKLNRRGTACECPEGMTKRGNSCIERERRPQIDFPTRIPGIGFPGGDHRPPRGGNDNPGGPRDGVRGSGGAGKP